MTSQAIDLETIPLDHGAHRKPPWEKGGGCCAMEKTALYVRFGIPGVIEPHTDFPFTDRPEDEHDAHVSPVIARLMRAMNDRLADEPRQILDPYTKLVIGTAAGRDAEATRSWMALDWLIHEYAPAMFRYAGCTKEAETFEQFAAVVDLASWQAVRDEVYRTRDEMCDGRRTAVARLREALKGADAGADAVAVAVAVAVADAVATRDADAVAVAVAVAVADAVAVAVAVADAVATRDADATRDVYLEAIKAAAAHVGYSAQRDAAYKVLRPFYDARLGDLSKGLLTSFTHLLDRMIEVGKADKQ